MSWRASAAIAKHELRVLRTDPSTALFLVVMPLGMVALTKRLFAGALAAEGVSGATGAEFAVPGMAVSFAAFGVGYAGFAFFRDHGWGTWDRLRATPAASIDILAGKVLPSVAVTIVQIGLLLALGGPLFGLRVTGSWWALMVLIVALSVSLNAFGVAVTAIARTSQQLNALGSVGGMALAMLGGSFVPFSAMPGWAQAVAPAIPTYWGMRGLRAVILDGGAAPDVALPSLIMLAFAAGFAVLAAARFRFEDSKVYYG